VDAQQHFDAIDGNNQAGMDMDMDRVWSILAPQRVIVAMLEQLERGWNEGSSGLLSADS
jgi:hypothetical protein